MTPTTRLKTKPIPNPIARPVCSASEPVVYIEDEAIMVDKNIKTANPIPKNDGTNKIKPIVRTMPLKRATLEAVIDLIVLQACQSSCNGP